MVDSPRYTRTGDGSGKMEAKTVAGDRVKQEMGEGRGKQKHPIFTISVLRYSICDLRVFNLEP